MGFVTQRDSDRVFQPSHDCLTPIGPSKLQASISKLDRRAKRQACRQLFLCGPLDESRNSESHTTAPAIQCPGMSNPSRHSCTRTGRILGHFLASDTITVH
ncbi:hypothetical protein AB1N83_011822 [Pleurotus pulmonarius]